MWDSLLSWDWTGFSKTVLGAGIGTTLVQGFFVWLRERNERGAQAAHLATQLVFLLEKYVRTCCDFIERNANAPHLPDEQFPAWDIKLPSTPQLPDDIQGWRALNRQLATKVQALQGHVEERQTSIYSTVDFCTDELETELPGQAVELALEAIHLAKALRRKYRLGTTTSLHNQVEWLNQNRSKAKSENSQWRRAWPFMRT